MPIFSSGVLFDAARPRPRLIVARTLDSGPNASSVSHRRSSAHFAIEVSV